MAEVVVRPVTPERWPQLERLFGPSGAYSNCWCTFFRVHSKAFTAGCAHGGAVNKELLHRLTVEGAVPGLLAFRGPDPVGWVSVAPREQFARVTASPLLRPPDPGASEEDAVWSVVCFWAPRANRGQGIGAVLLRGAVEHAYAGGARAVEGYPVEIAHRWPGQAAIYHGTVGQFERAGFRVVRRPNDRRAIMRHTPPC